MGKEGKVYICSKAGCSQSFTNRTSRIRHQNTCILPDPDPVTLSLPVYFTEDGIKKMRCSTCETVYKNKSSFSRHKKECRKNLDSKRLKVLKIKEPLKCKYCEKSFPKPSKLKRHEQTHEKQRLFCSHCNRSFKRLDQCQRHEARCAAVLLNEDDTEQQADLRAMIELFYPDVEEQEHLEAPEIVPCSIPRPSLSDELPSASSADQANVIFSDNASLESILLSLDQCYGDNNQAYDLDEDSDHVQQLSPDHTDLDEILPDADSFVLPDPGPTESPHTPLRTKQRDTSNLKKNLDRSLGDITPSRTKRLLNAADDSNTVELLARSNTIETLQFARAGMSAIAQFNAPNNRGYVKLAQEIVKVFGAEVVQDDGLLNFILSKCNVSRPWRVRASLRYHINNNFSSEKRTKVTLDIKQRVYNKWLSSDCSIVTADRRNKRDRVLISENRFLEKYPGIQDVNLEKTTKRGTPSYSAVRKITTKTVRQFQKELADTDGIDLSLGIIQNLKPFYLGPPSLREQIL